MKHISTLLQHCVKIPQGNKYTYIVFSKLCEFHSCGMCIPEICFNLLIVKVMEKKKYSYMFFCPQVIFLTAHFILNVVYLYHMRQNGIWCKAMLQWQPITCWQSYCFASEEIPLQTMYSGDRCTTMYFTIFITSKVGTRVLGLFMLLIIPTFIQKHLRPKHPLKQSTMALLWHNCHNILFPERYFLFLRFKGNHWLLPSSVQSLYCCCYITNTENL